MNATKVDLIKALRPSFVLPAFVLISMACPVRADWAVQVAMFAKKEHVSEEAARLTNAGFPVATENFKSNANLPMTRLLVGPFPDRASAQAAAKKLSSQGWPGYLHRFTPAVVAAPIQVVPAEAPPRAPDSPGASSSAIAPADRTEAKPAPEAAAAAEKPEDVEIPAGPKTASAGVVAAKVPAEKPATSGGQTDPSRLPEEVIPLEKLPDRPHPLIELGSPFLGTGTLSKGFTIPGGATWQPSFLVWGNLRSGIYDMELGNDTRRSAWLNRLDFLGQLNLTKTERVLVSFRPLDENGQFSGYSLAPTNHSEQHFNGTVRTLYFEGDFGEIFPDLDPNDRHAVDYGFAVGRMPLFFQEGMLINDAMDAVGVVRNSLPLSPSASNLRLTGIVSWGQVNRGGNQVLDPSAKLLGLFSEFDVPSSTVDIDAAYVDAGATTGSGLYGGISSVQRIAGWLNTTVRAVGSWALDKETTSVGKGVLLYVATSWTPEGTEDVAYVNAYGAIKNYTPAARDAGLGGPLVNVGILYEATLGTGYGAVLPNRAKDSYGGAIGYQWILGSRHTRRTQIIFEIGARKGTVAPDNKAEGAFAIRFQQAIGRRLIARVEGFAHVRQDLPTQYGARYELQVKF